MILAKLVVGTLICSFLGLSTMCKPDTKSKNYRKTHKTTKHYGKAKKTEKAKSQQEVEPPQLGNQVNLEWVARYDELLSKHGEKLSPPKKPGDRAGITVHGKYDIISPKVQQDFETLKQLDHKQ